MKKIYYVIPLFVFPLIFLAVELEKELLRDLIYENNNILRISLRVMCFVFAAIMGSMSKTSKLFDLKITASLPLSFLLTLFVIFHFDNGCEGLRFSIIHAFTLEYYILYLPMIAVMTAITFLASFKPIRLSGWLCKTTEK